LPTAARQHHAASRVVHGLLYEALLAVEALLACRTAGGWPPRPAPYTTGGP